MLRFTSIKYIALLVALTTASYAQTYRVLYNFGGVAGDPTKPWGTIAQSRGGAMLATSTDEYADRLEKAFRITTGGSLTVLHSFDGSSGRGLTLGTDGRYYGVNETDGTPGDGTVFKMSVDGTVTTLHNFQSGAEGEFPLAAPIESEQGDFYGTTLEGVNNYLGAVYSITKDGNFTLLHTFTGNDGEFAQDQLVQGTDFNFYGTMNAGGTLQASNGSGTIYRVSRSGDFKVLVFFNGTNGAHPVGGLIQAKDGNFYGVTYSGGPLGYGVLFRMKPDGTLTVLHNFSGGSDGGYAQAGLVQASDGNLYGTNWTGGAYGDGVLFRSTLAGNVVPLHDFRLTTGRKPWSPLLQHTNGILYGDTFGGGKFTSGVFYSFDAGLPPFVTYLPVYGRAGAEVEILGQGFTDSSVVSFNGTLSGSVTVVSPTYLTAVVPEGATTGPITVTTSSGTLTSNKVFIVH